MRLSYSPRKIIPVVALSAVLASGCAGLSMCVRDVVFEDPIKKLGIVDVEPNLQEKLGIVLRLIPPAEGRLQASEETRIYARVQNGRGIEMDLKRTIHDTYLPCTGPDSCGESFRLLSESAFSGGPGKIIEETEMTTRGEIVRFLRGTHESQIGQFRILDWKRTPLFPEAPVKLGDEWRYEETMNVRMKSIWVKEKDSNPYRVDAVSKLTGFAMLGSKRVAVIKTFAKEMKAENLKVLFKNVELHIYTNLEETAYFDYEKGMVLAKITRAHSMATSPDSKLNDVGESQSIYYLNQP